MLNGISDLMGAQTDRLRCEVFQNLILSPINTGTLRHAVATVLTVYGIETTRKRDFVAEPTEVAIAPTVYGIETIFTKLDFKFLTDFSCNSTYRLRYWKPWNWFRFNSNIFSCNSTYCLRY